MLFSVLVIQQASAGKNLGQDIVVDQGMSVLIRTEYAHLQGVQSDPCVSVGVYSDLFQCTVLGLDLSAGKASLIGQSTPLQLHQILRAQGIEYEYFAAGQ